jgi:hypothetical protein
MSGSPRERRGARRGGFALLAVLWVLVSAAVLSLLLLRTAREAVGAATNRRSATLAEWSAEGCAARARAAIDAALDGPAPDAAWSALDRDLPGSPALAGCEVALRGSGAALDVNAASIDELTALFIADGVPPSTADSVAESVADWRDTDDVARPRGAERDWYAAQELAAPRNAPFRARGEIGAVRGMAAVRHYDALLDVDAGPVSLTRAPAAVLATLPGFESAVVAVALALRARGVDGYSLGRIASELSPDERRRFESHLPALVAHTTTATDAWTLVARARRGVPAVERTVEMRLVRANGRVVLTGRRGGAE